MDIFVVA